MKYLIVCVVLFAVACQAFDCPGTPGGDLNKGDGFQPKGQCAYTTCDGAGIMSGKTCPSSAAPATCKHIPEDASKPWPKCCESYEC